MSWRTRPVSALVLALGVLIVVQACHGIRDRELRYQPKDWSSVEFRLEREQCMGFCPDYTLVIRGDGSVSYEGRAHVALIGSTAATVARETLEDLMRQFAEADYLEFDDKCAVIVFDSANSTVSFSIDGRTRARRNVEHHVHDAIDWLRCNRSMHAQLDELAEAIDAAAGSERWVGSKGP